MRIKTRILSSSSSFPTCRLLRDAVEELTGKHFWITSSPEGFVNVVLRYGNSLNTEGTDTNFNSREFITLTSNKLKFSQFCADNGIYSPVFYSKEIPKEFPVVIRSTLTGWGGKGISFVESIDEFNKIFKPGFYWTPFIKTTYEIRVHLFDITPNRIYKKVKDGEATYPIRNSDNGYHYSLQSEITEGKYKKAKDLAERLGNLFVKIGGHFSGLDLAYDPNRKEYIVWEANSAPGLNTQNAIEYAKFISDKLELGGKNVPVEENVQEE